MPYDDRYGGSSAAPVKKAHNLSLEERKKLNVSGVLDVESFDEHEIVMETGGGCLIIRGEELSIGKLSVDTGDVRIEGSIRELLYEETAPQESLWTRLFH